MTKPAVTGLDEFPGWPAFSDSMIREAGDDGESDSTETVDDVDFFRVVEVARIL